MIKLKHEVGREAFNVPLDLLVEASGLDAIELCEIGVEKDLLSSDEEDTALDAFNRYQ